MKLLSIQSRDAFEAWVFQLGAHKYKIEFRSLGKPVGAIEVNADNQSLVNPWLWIGKAATL